ncbi:hypothetical protein FOZ60_001256 [Perkinsus olseni]|uniref:Uncharacterized protein n=1 Tax=Perkinsus olseni TaxID=32597 RepID=A0A7J6MTB9_PEROL|nr:hypothetical protein FOZ60_001256 [Perkinsus olseni]
MIHHHLVGMPMTPPPREAQSRSVHSSESSLSLVRSRVANIMFYVTLFLFALKPLVHMAEGTIYPWYTKKFVEGGNLSKSDVLIGFLGPLGHIGYFGSGLILSLPTVRSLHDITVAQLLAGSPLH